MRVTLTRERNARNNDAEIATGTHSRQDGAPHEVHTERQITWKEIVQLRTDPQVQRLRTKEKNTGIRRNETEGRGYAQRKKTDVESRPQPCRNEITGLQSTREDLDSNLQKGRLERGVANIPELGGPQSDFGHTRTGNRPLVRAHQTLQDLKGELAH